MILMILALLAQVEVAELAAEANALMMHLAGASTGPRSLRRRRMILMMLAVLAQVEVSELAAEASDAHDCLRN